MGYQHTRKVALIIDRIPLGAQILITLNDGRTKRGSFYGVGTYTGDRTLQPYLFLDPQNHTTKTPPPILWKYPIGSLLCVANEESLLDETREKVGVAVS